ncbi:hypothetical protein AB4074_23475, partial [Arthrobacter sp. 2MCAF14]
MTEPSDLHATRAAYNTVAADYAELLRNELDTKPFDRAMLGAFAELVRSSGGRAVADIGCGPGRITAYLDSLGLAALASIHRCARADDLNPVRLVVRAGSMLGCQASLPFGVPLLVLVAPGGWVGG